MLQIAALITTDGDETRFGGLDLSERAALVAQSAGISHVFFVGPHLPDFATLTRLRERGVVASALLGWPRPFAALPLVRTLVVLPARTIAEPAALTAVVQESAKDPESAAVIVNEGPARKANIINVEGRQVRSVIGDGNATSTGVMAIPAALMTRVRGVWDLQDAIHRLAKAGELRGVSAGPYFCRQLEATADVTSIERRYYLHTMRIAMSDAAARLLRWPASFKSSAEGRLVPVR